MKAVRPQKKILPRLRESEDLYKTLVNNLVYPIIIHVGGKVVFANDIVLEFAGLTMDEIAGHDLAEIFKDPVDSENIENLYRLFVDPNVTEEEIEIRTTSGKLMIHTFLLRNSRIKYGGQDAVLSMLFDITNRKQVGRFILGKVIETEEKDRKRFAADLHDDLGPTLSAIKLHLGILNQDTGREQLTETLGICTTLLNEAILKMRIISNNLMPRLIEDYGLEPALNAFIKTVTREGVFSVKFSSNLGNKRFQRLLELHLYRIICELINNTIKHACATVATLKLNWNDNKLKVFYSDNGKGYKTGLPGDRPSGMGIGNILDRVDIIEGQIRFSGKEREDRGQDNQGIRCILIFLPGIFRFKKGDGPVEGLLFGVFRGKTQIAFRPACREGEFGTGIDHGKTAEFGIVFLHRSCQKRYEFRDGPYCIGDFTRDPEVLRADPVADPFNNSIEEMKKVRTRAIGDQVGLPGCSRRTVHHRLCCEQVGMSDIPDIDMLAFSLSIADPYIEPAPGHSHE